MCSFLFNFQFRFHRYINIYPQFFAIKQITLIDQLLSDNNNNNNRMHAKEMYFLYPVKSSTVDSGVNSAISSLAAVKSLAFRSI